MYIAHILFFFFSFSLLSFVFLFLFFLGHFFGFNWHHF